MRYINKQQIKEARIEDNGDGFFNLILTMDYTYKGNPIEIEVLRVTELMCAEKATELGLSLL